MRLQRGESIYGYDFDHFMSGELQTCTLVGGGKAGKGEGKVDYYFNLPAGPITRGGTCCFGEASELCRLKCYAQGGNFVFRTVQRAAARSYYCSQREDFADRIVYELGRYSVREAKEGNDTLFFRLHSSGEFYSPNYVKQWQLVVDKIMATSFATRVALWAPTRNYFGGFMPELIKLNNMADNDKAVVSIRPSVLGVGDAPPVVPGLDAGTTVVDGLGDCPAVQASIINTQNKNKIAAGTAQRMPHTCKGLGCRRCWLSPKQTVTYGLHGAGVTGPFKREES